PGYACDFRNISRKRHVIPLREGGQHGLKGADAALKIETTAVITGSSHRADAQLLCRIGVDLTVAMARNQDLDSMSAAEKWHNEMLAIPQGDDAGRMWPHDLVKIGRLYGEATGPPHQPKVLSGEQADKSLYRRRPRDAS